MASFGVESEEIGLKGENIFTEIIVLVW